MTALSIAQDAAVEVGVATPSLLFATTDKDATLLRRLLNKGARSLAKRHDWQKMTVQHTWVTTATEAQASAFPADFDRPVVYTEVWNRSLNQPVAGPPTSSRVWIRLHNGVSGGVVGWARIIGGVLNIFPVPTAGQTYAFDYVSKNFAAAAVGGAGQAAFLADGDTTKLDEELLTLDLIWRWRQRKGFDYAEDMATFERELELAASRDRGVGILRPPQNPPADFIDPIWPGTITVP